MPDIITQAQGDIPIVRQAAGLPKANANIAKATAEYIESTENPTAELEPLNADFAETV